jgi:3-dehydroquinate synthase
MNTLKLKSNIRDYEVEFCETFDFIDDLKHLEKKVFVIDKNIYNLYQRYFNNIAENELFLFDAIEEKKTLDSVEELYRFLAQKDAKRNITLISFGGGITQDVTGFVASTLYRGIKWIFVPTTFLAQADSCIGSKTSLNFEKYKNILGGFYPPNKIYIQPKFLDTLTTKDYYSGIGEVIKFALLKEAYPKDFQSIIEMIDRLKNKQDRLLTIKKTMEVKKAYIDEDEFDTGKRNLFNYGHCFGHALENASHYEIPHGIAVTIGMVYANIVSLGRRLLSEEKYEFLNEKLLLPNIPIALEAGQFDKTVLLESMKNDKKRVGKDLTIVIPVDDDMRARKIDDLTEEEFTKAYKQLIQVLELN